MEIVARGAPWVRASPICCKPPPLATLHVVTIVVARCQASLVQMVPKKRERSAAVNTPRKTAKLKDEYPGSAEKDALMRA